MDGGMLLALIAIAVVVLIVAGSVAGLVSFVQVRRLKRAISEGGGSMTGEMRRTLEARHLEAVEQRLRRLEERLAVVAEEIAAPQRAPVEQAAGRAEGPQPRAAIAPAAPPPLPPERIVAKAAPPPGVAQPRVELSPGPPKPRFPWGGGSIEEYLGFKGLAWVGGILLLIACAYGLKEAYDRFIGPAGRLAIGVFLGMAALGAGEYFRRRDWKVLFNTFTGLGIGILYVCVYFSFHVYHFSNQGVSFALAAVVTLLAVVMAVAHDAMSIAILALIGGFLSPVLISTQENHPYALFAYIAILDLVAFGAAYYRRWRAVDVLCLSGTVLMYSGWYERFYDATQLTPALLFTSVFYVMFLVIPVFHTLVRNAQEKVEGLVLVVVSAALSLCSYYVLLFHTHRTLLGFLVLGQALLTFLLFRAWLPRKGAQTQTAYALIAITLGLVVLAVPLQFRLYGVPLAWALEGVLFVYLGLRFGNRIARVSGLLVLGLAAFKLFERLPLHSKAFHPVLNVPFGSWAAVIAMAAAAAYLLVKRREADPVLNGILGALAVLLAFVLGCIVLSLETVQFWEFKNVLESARFAEMKNAIESTASSHEAAAGALDSMNRTAYHARAMASLIVLWSLIPAATLAVLRRYRLERWTLLALACYVVGAALFLVGLERSFYSFFSSAPLAANSSFLTRLAFLISLWWAGTRPGLRIRDFSAAKALEGVGHVLLTILLFVELDRWSGCTEVFSHSMILSFVSAAWAIQAFGLTWLGLFTRSRMRRYFGFALFGLTALKVCIVDTQELAKVYRIVSFGACGALMLAAAVFYHRYRSRFLDEPKPEEKR